MSDTKTILIVDDCESDRLLCRGYIQNDPDISYLILEAETIKQAIDIWRSRKPDLALIDFNLTDGNGLEFLEAIKSNNSSEGLADTKLAVIMLTGHGDERVAVNAMKLGAFDYLVKSDITEFSLRQSIHSLLDRFALSSKLKRSQTREVLVSQIALNIRQFVNLEDICQAIVQEIRKFLKADRAIIYKFNENMSRRIISEALVPPWHSCSNFISEDSCLNLTKSQASQYKEGKVLIASDIYAANFAECHIQMLERFQIRANVVVPILLSKPIQNTVGHNTVGHNFNTNDPCLWGLLIVHQCSAPRVWEDGEIQLLQQLSIHLAIAIQQAEIYQNLKNLNISLEQQVQERTADLRANEQKLRSILDAIPDIINLVDGNGIYLESNRSNAFFNLIPTDGDPVGKHITELLPVEIALNQMQAIQQAISTREIQTLTQTFWVKDCLRYQEARVAPVQENLVTIVVRDISDRKHTEIALERELLRNKTLVNTSFDGIFALDNEGNIIEANLSFAKILGYTLEEITQLSIYDIDVKQTREELTRKIQEFKFGKRVKFKTRYIRKNGSICHAEISANSIEWDDEIALFCICRDITQRNKAKQALLHREQEIRTLIENAPDIIARYDRSLRHIYVNPSIEKATGIPLQQFIGKSKRELGLPRHLVDICDHSCEKVFTTGEPDVIEFELTVSNKIRYFQARIVPEFDAVGNVVSVMAISRDFTEQKIAEQVLQQTAISLAQAKESAEAASKAKSAFLAMMSHEIRTPMNGVVGMAELLANTPLEEDQKNLVQIILDSGDVLLNIINDILDFSKVESGNLQLESKEFNFTDVLSSTCKLLSKQAFDKNINLQCHFNQDLPTTVIGDSSRLRQIFINLISNAIKFTSQGFISVTVSGRWITSNTYEFRFSISDTGIGINSDQISKLFKPFTQADASINRQFGGTGLGLAICKKLVELMQGSLWVESCGQVGGNPPSDWIVGDSNNNTQGSTFHFVITLPVISENQTIKNQTIKKIDSLISIEPDVDFKQFPIKILVVEDNLFNQKIIQLILKRLGYETDVVENGQESLTVLSNQESGQEYDLIFMDIQMPVMDGITATKIIRENSSSQTKPWIIALTANVLPADQQACMDAGMNDYVTKPVNIKQIVRSLSEYIRVSTY